MGTEFNNGFGTNNMWNSYEQKNRMSYTGVRVLVITWYVLTYLANELFVSCICILY